MLGVVVMDVNYKNPKKYKTAKYPIRQPIYLTWLIQMLSKMMLIGKEHKVEKFNMEGLKPPYLLLSNHMSFVDFELVSLGTYPQRVNNVVNIDGFYMRAWLLEWIGAICTRKFTTDLHLIKSIKKVIERGDVLCMYPEARYSPDGTTAYLPESLGALVKMLNVPVVVVTHHGNYLHSPFWNFRKKRKVPLYTTFNKIWDPEDYASLSIDEINDGLKKAFEYDDYKYQKENGILITEPYRAEGLHKILYQCPHCKTESKMASEGAALYCTECGKRWYQNEDGSLTAKDGETEFSHIPDWFDWEREQVREQVRNGTYHFEDEVEVYSLPRCYKYEPLGFAKLTHTIEDGFILEGHYRGQDYKIHRMPLQTNSLHIEYDFLRIKPFGLVDISTENDSFYCYTTKPDVITKLAFATEEIYQLALENRRNAKK